MRTAPRIAIPVVISGRKSGSQTPICSAPTLTACRNRLIDAIGMVGDSDAEILAEELRLAVESLEFVVGRIDPEAVLDTVFHSFCLGK